MTSNVPYQRIQIQRVPEKPIILKVVIPLVLLFFVLFCLIGYLNPPPPHNGAGRHMNKQNPPGYTSLTDTDLLQRLKSTLPCKSTDNEFRIKARGNFWVVENFLAPRRERPLECYESITYTTHGDYRFLDNVIPLLDRWQGPLSLAIYAPGEEFEAAIEALRALMYCHRQSYLLEEFAAVHLYFDFDRMPPKPIQFYRDIFETDCKSINKDPAITKPAITPNPNHTYPVNVGRNIAREAAQTHFVLTSDIELYPNPGFIDMFLRMIAQPMYEYTLDSPSVYVLPIFEVSEVSPVPEDKAELLQMLTNGDAIKFHEKICPQCHTVPYYDRWLKVVKTDGTMDILASAKREGQFALWEPIYVGTKREPQYQERLNWEGKFDKMSQGYIMCVLGYSFHILDNGFLVHRPGIKQLSEAARPELERKQRKFVEEVIFEELKVLYGENEHCKL